MATSASPNPFSPELAERLLREHWSESTVKVNGDSMKMMAELLRRMTLEALRRAQDEAAVEGTTEVEPQHLEQILPQLLLDF